MTEHKGYTEHSKPRKTHGKKPKRIIYEHKEREAQEEIKEYTREELPNMQASSERYKP